jgi:hypothetical protein
MWRAAERSLGKRFYAEKRAAGTNLQPLSLPNLGILRSSKIGGASSSALGFPVLTEHLASTAFEGRMG